MEGWKKTEIGLMPIDWEVNRIDNFFSIQQGKQVSKKNRIGDNQKPFLRTKNIFWGRLDLDELDQMNFTKSEEEKYELKKGDLLVCEGGSVGRTAIWDGAISGCYYQNHLHRVRRLTKNTIPEFVSYWFYYAFEFGKVYFGRANETTLSNLSKSRLSELHIPHPELNEQRKIAYILSTIQKAIDQQDKLIKTTTELKKALMQKLFTEGLYGEKQKQTEIGPVPESWEVKPLIEAVESIDYGLSKSIPKVPPKNGVKIVSTADITREGELLYWKIRKTEAPEKTINRLLLNEGDLLFNWRNSPELIGKSTVYHKQSEPHIFASFILRINCGEKKSHNYYLKHLMNFWREESVFVQLSRRAVNQANYNKNEISVLKIPVPSYNEQVEIAETIGKVEIKIEHHKSIKKTFTDLFKTLLHELMTGQRRVHEIEFENGLEL